MKFLKSHFALSRSQQNGIFVLIILIVLFQSFIWFYDELMPAKTEPVPGKELESFMARIDSLDSNNNNRRDTIYPFNPNYLTDFKGYELGMSPEQIDRLLEYRKENKWINSREEFQKVTGVSDSLLQAIAPSFRFPEWTQKLTSPKLKERPVEKNTAFADLNTATEADLRRVRGIGEVLSGRIVKYRYRIGGYLDPIQLNDVYGLSPEVILEIQKHFAIISKPDVRLKNINTIGQSELAEIPYFNPELAREIINYRSLHEGIRSFEELSKISKFPSDKIDRIKLYLALE